MTMEDRQTAAEIEAEAARWTAVLDRAPDDPAVRDALDAWLAGDPRRRGALLQMQATWRLLDVRPEAVSPAVPRVASPPRRRWPLALAAAAAVAALAGGALLEQFRGRHETAVGEVLQVPLADGSAMAINTRSLVRAEFDADVRAVELREGEALFTVAKDPARPFVVTAGAVTVTAVGTAFAVRRAGDGVRVSVTEGVVEVRAGSRPVRLAAGEAGNFDAGRAPELSTPGPEALARALAWREGRLELDGEPLQAAVAEINRHNRRPVRVADPALAAMPLYGAFRTNDPLGFARTVGASLGVAVVEDDDAIRIGTPPAG